MLELENTLASRSQDNFTHPWPNACLWEAKNQENYLYMGLDKELSTKRLQVEYLHVKDIYKKELKSIKRKHCPWENIISRMGNLSCLGAIPDYLEARTIISPRRWSWDLDGSHFLAMEMDAFCLQKADWAISTSFWQNLPQKDISPILPDVAGQKEDLLRL